MVERPESTQPKNDELTLDKEGREVQGAPHKKAEGEMEIEFEEEESKE